MAGKIRIRLKAFDHAVIDQTAADIAYGGEDRRARQRADPASDASSAVDGAPLPHIDKKSREQFELKTHKRVIDIMESGCRRSTLTKLDLPASTWKSRLTRRFGDGCNHRT